MKQIKIILLLIGKLTQLFIECVIGMITTLAIMMVVYPLSFLTNRLKAWYYEVKNEIEQL